MGLDAASLRECLKTKNTASRACAPRLVKIWMGIGKVTIFALSNIGPAVLQCAKIGRVDLVVRSALHLLARVRSACVSSNFVRYSVCCGELGKNDGVAGSVPGSG